MWLTKPNQLVPPCFKAPGAYGPKIANNIKIIAIKGNVNPTDLLVASKVRTISIVPIRTSICSGFPTLWAKISDGSNGKYKADATAKIAKTISKIGIFWIWKKFFLFKRFFQLKSRKTKPIT